jgi:hypothetical protein
MDNEIPLYQPDDFKRLTNLKSARCGVAAHRLTWEDSETTNIGNARPRRKIELKEDVRRARPDEDISEVEDQETS